MWKYIQQVALLCREKSKTVPKVIIETGFS